MSVEPGEFESEVWTRWQGHVINGVYPLGRYLGGSDHSGVFLTKAAASPADVAIKLVPTNRALAESQLPRWKRAGALAHPHLLCHLDWGGCQLDGLPYLFSVMEYADQTLAQLLLNRALTDDETREMLSPTLDALAYLHARNLVQGQLKPANVLVVGDQLKVSSDSIRRLTESRMSTNALTVYDPPEARQGTNSAAGDIWALGLTLFEALTRQLPAGLGESRQPVLPANFSPAFRDIVGRCLNLSPEGRPTVAELQGWAGGGSTPVAAAGSRPSAPESVVAPEPAPARAAPEAARPTSSTPKSPQPRALLPVVIGALAVFALGWAGLRALRGHHTPPPAPVQAPEPSLASPGAAAPAAPVSPVSATKAGRTESGASPSALHEVIPDVAAHARHTIRGHISVWVRVIVDQNGTVIATVVDRGGPSRYFQRLATDAAKKWTFPVAETATRRVMQIRFDFSRDGTTGRAVAVS